MNEPERIPYESRLSIEQIEKFLSFAQQVTALDATPPFSEQTLVTLRQSVSTKDAAVRLFLIGDEKQDIRAAWVALLPQDGEPGLLEGAVHPDYRGTGLASTLLSYMATEGGIDFTRYQGWAHQVLSDTSGQFSARAAHLAQKLGMHPVRELRKMRLELSDPTRTSLLAQHPALPAGVTLETFDAQQDAAAWVELNAQAFASHPEQGKLTLRDLEERLASDWYRPEGFFLAQTVSDPAGYIWTKIPADQAEAPVGEIYAVGVSPSWQGKGMGRALTISGLQHLAETSYSPGVQLAAIVLYVDADNKPATSLYESLGFINETVDIMYARKN